MKMCAKAFWGAKAMSFTQTAVNTRHFLGPMRVTCVNFFGKTSYLEAR
jgi:hypothetical protein